jgi:hypothetical protein
VIEIADDGPGIPIALRDRNLTPEDVGRGTGLGLSPARNIIVGRHGGSLTVDSRAGRTTFRVSIPICVIRAMRSPTEKGRRPRAPRAMSSPSAVLLSRGSISAPPVADDARVSASHACDS